MSEEKEEKKAPQKRRAKGEGTIYWDEKRELWVGQATIGTDSKTGKRLRPTFYGKKQGDVVRAINKAKHEIEIGAYTDPDKLTLGKWLDVWLEEYSRPTIRPSTYDSYEQLIRNHIKPKLGHYPLQKLQTPHIQRFYNNRLKAKRIPRAIPKDKAKAQELIERSPTISPATIRHMHVILKQALGQAVAERRILFNPASEAKPPKHTRKEISYLTGEQVNNFLEEISEDPWYPAFLLAIGTGMRLGEVAALRWANVDLEKRILHVKEAVRRVYKSDRSGEDKTELLIHPPKSEKGKRTIPLPARVLAEMKKHRVRQAELKLQIGEIYDDRGFVFAWEDGRMVDPAFLSKRFKGMITRCGHENVTFHGLRHSFATALLEAGEHPRTVQELLGDSTVQVVLDIYSHVSPEIKERAAETIDAFLKPKPSQKREG